MENEFRKRSQVAGEKGTETMIYFIIALAIHIALEVLFPIPEKVVAVYWTFRIVGIISAIGALVLFFVWMYFEVIFYTNRYKAYRRDHPN